MTSERARALRGLYAVTSGVADTGKLLAQVNACLDGGAALVQYRAKDLPGALKLEQARALAAACRSHGAPLIVNDSVDLALAAGANGVHLGREDGDPRAARRAFPHGILGVSCYNEIERARDAGAAGADYIGIGSVFTSATKPAAVHAPLELIARARAASGLPVAAIGGITAANAPLALAAGADMVAVIGALFEARDIAAAAQDFARLFETQRPGPHDARAQPQPL
jgi:thiamine-phosphate pyrophosphorylase